MSTLTHLGSLLLTPLYYLVSVVLVGWHRLLTDVVGLAPGSGAGWILSIIGLTVVIRTALIPVFVKQIRASRNLQLLQPRIKELQEKHGHDRERLAQETMTLYRESGTNPFASCLPLLIQAPIFLALFRLINQAADHGTGHGVLSDTLAAQPGGARLFGDLPISATFLHPGPSVGVQVLAGALVLVMGLTTFVTQHQLMTRNTPNDASTGPHARQQRLLLYLLPVVFAVGGVAFPIGVLAYWTTSNVWTMAQQLYVIRNSPAPHSPAMRAKQTRDGRGHAPT